MNQLTLDGKTALVTGASQGIGLACAGALARDGATVVIMGRRADALKKAKVHLATQAPDARIEMFPGDACDETQVKAALAFAHELDGHLDILVGVVGGPTFKPLLMRELDDMRQEMDLNFTSAFLLVRHGVPLMERGGAIVCISTIAAVQSGWGLCIYGSAKAALERFVRGAAYELGGAGIRINSVRPGATLSEEEARKPEYAPLMEAFVAETPMGRRGEPDDIGSVVRFLAGPEAGWVTGQTFSVDGGLDQGRGPDFMDAFYGKEIMDKIRKGKVVDRNS